MDNRSWTTVGLTIGTLGLGAAFLGSALLRTAPGKVTVTPAHEIEPRPERIPARDHGAMPSRVEAEPTQASLETMDSDSTVVLDFDARIAEILTVSRRGLEALSNGGPPTAAVEGIDRRVHRLVEDLETAIAATPEHALERWRPGADERVERMRHELYLHLLRRGLTARLGRGKQSDPDGAPEGNRPPEGHRPLDLLVSRILLRTNECSETAHRLVGHLLIHQRFLSIAHEATLEELSFTALEHGWMNRVTADLLFTLWTNLVHSGQRSAEEQRRRVAGFRNDERPAHRLAASRWVFERAESTERAEAVRGVLERSDVDAARMLARTVASTRSGPDALTTIQDLYPLLLEATFESLATVVARDPEAVKQHYDQLLATKRAPEFREQLIGSLFGGDRRAAGSVSREALLFEESVSTRRRALLLAATSLPIDEVETWFSATLQDRRLGSMADRLSLVTYALQNLASRGARERIAWWAARLEADPALPEPAQTAVVRARQLAGV